MLQIIFFLKQDLKALKNKVRGSWLFEQARDKNGSRKHQHSNPQNHLPRNERDLFVPH
jgi:hypothetical protein